MASTAYTTAEIDRAVARTKHALSQFPEGSITGATTQFLLELYLGSLDNAKEARDDEKAMSASS